jgi:hypothetical protein
MRIIATLVFAVVLIGCPAKGPYHDAVVAEHDFKTGVASFQQAEIKEFQAGRIDAATHQKLESGIEKVGLAGQTLVTALQSGAANATVQADFTTVSAALLDLLNNGVLGIKDPTSQALLKTIVQTAQAILSNVGSLLSVPVTAPVTVSGTYHHDDMHCFDQKSEVSCDQLFKGGK